MKQNIYHEWDHVLKVIKVKEFKDAKLWRLAVAIWFGKFVLIFLTFFSALEILYPVVWRAISTNGYSVCEKKRPTMGMVIKVKTKSIYHGNEIDRILRDIKVNGSRMWKNIGLLLLYDLESSFKYS